VPPPNGCRGSTIRRSRRPVRRGRAFDSLIERSDELIQAHRFDEAISLLRKGVKRFPDDPYVMLRLAHITTESDEAKALVRRVGPSVSDDAPRLTVCATIMFHHNELVEASEYVARAVAVDPSFRTDPGLLHVAGRIAAVREENERAEDMLRAAYLADPEATHHGAAFGEILAIRGKYDEALEVIDESLKHFASDEWLLRLRGEILATRGE
jgi:tetratricopeptide (TPR) repeat protein